MLSVARHDSDSNTALSTKELTKWCEIRLTAHIEVK